MDEHSIRGSEGGRPRVEVQAVAARAAAAVLMTAVALVAVAISGGSAPRLTLTGQTWHWTGLHDTVPGEALVVTDPAAYAITFRRDRTFEAVADCNRVAGEYDSVPAGRAGGATNSLMIDAGQPTTAACDPGSLDVVFLANLEAARRYAIDGSTLTIALDPRGAMTFEAAGSVPGPSTGAGFSTSIGSGAGAAHHAGAARTLECADAQGGPHLDHALEVDLAPAPRSRAPGSRWRGGEPALLPG
jgi:heat shock protein HslJ